MQITIGRSQKNSLKTLFLGENRRWNPFLLGWFTQGIKIPCISYQV